MLVRLPGGDDSYNRPVYPFNDPGSDIIIHDGTIEVVGIGAGPGQVIATMRGDLNINWEIDLDLDLPLGPATLRVTRPEFGPADISAEVNHNAGRGWISHAEFGTDQPLVRVLTNWVNLPWILPAGGINDARGGWAGHWEAEGGGWTFALDSRPDIGQVLEAQKGSAHFAITYSGELRRTDNAPFDAGAASEALYGWQMAFSFALGRWVAPALPVGFDAHGGRAWEQWAPWRCNQTTGYRSWWDNLNGDDLKDYMALFLGRWCSPGQQAFVRYVAHHLIAANQGATTTEARIMLVHAALDYFSWVKNVISGARSRTQHDKLSAEDRLRELLDVAQIPTGTTADFPGLSQIAGDGPAAVTWLRNRLVHPKDAEEPYRIEHLVSEAWQLSMHYGELILLHELGYQGRFLPRFPSRRFIRSREPVPWAP